MILNQISVYSQMRFGMIWNAWFNGGPAVLPGINASGINGVSFVNNGGAMAAEISENGSNGIEHEIDLNYINNVQQNANIMGFEYDLNIVEKEEKMFLLPEYFKLDPDNKWRAIEEGSCARFY
jgi:hypothetical protein